MREGTHLRRFIGERGSLERIKSDSKLTHYYSNIEFVAFLQQFFLVFLDKFFNLGRKKKKIKPKSP